MSTYMYVDSYPRRLFVNAFFFTPSNTINARLWAHGSMAGKMSIISAHSTLLLGQSRLLIFFFFFAFAFFNFDHS